MYSPTFIEDVTNIIKKSAIHSQMKSSQSVKLAHPNNSVLAAVYAFMYVKQMKKRISKSKYRKEILKQWSRTEKTYLEDIKMCLLHIKQPMLKANIISAQDSRVLFPEFESMVHLSKMMVQIIASAEKNTNPNKVLIGKEIQQIVSGFKIYGGYFGSLLKTQKKMAELSEDSEEEMKKIEQNLQAEVRKNDPEGKKGARTINEYMSQPQQRVFKYELLLKEYLKKLPPYHPDYEDVKQALKTFGEINMSNNELMTSLQEQEKKVKLHHLFGGALKEGRNFLGEMQADTIYFNGKIYIFNDLIIVTKTQSILGTEKDEKYMDMELNQFSYIGMQPDLKYFKNFLVLVGVEQCIHFFFPDKGSRLEMYKKIFKNLRDLRIRAFERRKLQGNQKMQKGKKIKFVLSDQSSAMVFQPEFRIEILGFQVRPLTTISNDTVYVTRFMLPYYQQDEFNFLDAQGLLDLHKTGKGLTGAKLQRYSKLPFGDPDAEKTDAGGDAILSKKTDFKCINQRIQVHFSALMEIYKEMCATCEQKLPNIDPVTKDVNLYSKGKRKTKSFEMRKFFVEEFFNFVFRQPDILKSPISYIKKLRVNESLWNYVIERNAILKREEQKNEKTYGYEHCDICKKANIQSLEEFEHYRNYYSTEKRHRDNKPLEKYCFNFFNLVRMRMLSFKYFSFNNLERVLTYYHYLEGRLDYPFIPHGNSDKMVKIVRISLPSLDDDSVSVVVDSNSTAGEVVDEICRTFDIRIGFDYDLVALYNGKTRIMDRDEFVVDTIKVLDIKIEEVSANKQVAVAEKEQGFFSSIKKWGTELFSSVEANKIYFMKTTYLYKSLELKTFMSCPQKRRMEVQKIFWAIKKSLIRLSEPEMTEICGLFYCLKDLDAISHFSPSKMSEKMVQRILPDEFAGAWLNKKQFRRQIGGVIEKQKQFLIKNNKVTEQIHKRVIEIVMEKPEYLSYYVTADVREVGTGLMIENLVPVTCLIGVNYKEFIMTRSEGSTVPLLKIDLNEIKFTSSVFSLFLTHEKGNLRFDGKMLFHFCELMRKYQAIKDQFPQH